VHLIFIEFCITNRAEIWTRSRGLSSTPVLKMLHLNWPLKTLIPEEIIVCPADPNMAWVTVYESSCMFKWTEAARIPESGVKNTCGSSFLTDPIFFCQRYYFFDVAKHNNFLYLCVISRVRILSVIQIMTKYWLVVWNTCILIIVRTTIYTVYM
jgi:hypothetical protein